MKFNKPEKLNGIQLTKELEAAGVRFADAEKSIFVDENNDMIINIAKADESKAKAVIDAHIGIDYPVTIESKLASVGLTVEELKALLA